MRLGDVNLAVSFAEDSEPYCRKLVAQLGPAHIVYYYKDFLAEQRGQGVSNLATAIYGAVPVVVLRTAGWCASSACQLEREVMNASDNPILVLEFTGSDITDVRKPNRHQFSIGSNTPDRAVYAAVLSWLGTIGS